MCERVYEEEEVPPGLIDIPSASKSTAYPFRRFTPGCDADICLPRAGNALLRKMVDTTSFSEEELLQCRDTPKSKGGRPPSAVK